MVALVDDHVTKISGTEFIDQVSRGRALDAREAVVPLLRLTVSNEQLAEGRILHRMPKRLARLIEELVAMGEE